MMANRSQVGLLDSVTPTPAHWAMRCTQDATEPWQPYAWTRLLNRELVELAMARAEFIRTGYTKRNRLLIVEAPVRHGKSNLGSVYFPSWWVGQFKDDRVIQTGHNTELASTFSVQGRDALDEFGEECFNVKISKGSHARDRWDLARPNRGGLIAVGVGNPPAGRGGHLIVVDDPIKSNKEARSKTYQQILRNWWEFDIRTRLEPGGCIVIIMSRWSIADLVGWLKEREIEYQKTNPGVEQIGSFKTLHLPALANSVDDPLGREIGAALCPERYTREDLINLRDGPSGVGPVAFEALYQNNPKPPEGTMFKVDKFRILEAIPMDRGIKWCRTFDLAATEKEVSSGDPDWTAGCLMGRTESGHTIIADVRRTRKNSDEVEEWVRATCEEDWARFGRPIPVRLPQDPGQAGKAQGNQYRRTVLYGMDFDTFTESGDKVVRATPLSGQVGAGNVYLVNGEWILDFKKECEGFPDGDHDDMVDAASNNHLILAGLLKNGARLVA